MPRDHYEIRLRDLQSLKSHTAAMALLWTICAAINYLNVINYAVEGLTVWVTFSCAFGGMLVGLGGYNLMRSLSAGQEVAALRGALAYSDLYSS